MGTITRPKYRGVPDLIAICLLVPGAGFLTWCASPGLATWAALIYAISVCLAIGLSAAYHVATWSPHQLIWLKRADFSAIYFLIAGTYTPVCLLLLDRPGRVIVAIAWTIAFLGVIKSFIWTHAPRWFSTSVYLAFGWMILPFWSELWVRGGLSFVLWITAGGLFYSIGAVVYARRWFAFSPTLWGYHESMHVFVVLAVCCHFLAIWELLVP